MYYLHLGVPVDNVIHQPSSATETKKVLLELIKAMKSIHEAKFDASAQARNRGKKKPSKYYMDALNANLTNIQSANNTSNRE